MSENPLDHPTADHLDRQVFVDYFEKTRWFGGKGRPFEVTAVHRIGQVPGCVDAGPAVVDHLVELTYGDAEGGTELYQVPISLYADPEQRLDHAFIGWWEEPERGWVHAYDALHDREAMACWLRSFVAAAEGPVAGPTGLTFHRLPGHDLDAEGVASLFTGEQSNSSVAFGEDSIMKLFRKVTPGPNPDVTIHEAMTRAGSTDVAGLYGWMSWTDPAGEEYHLAMLQQFLRTATDGWDLALASVRDLFAEGDLHAHEVGGDFAGESERLGLTLREVHEALRTHFPAERRGPEAARTLAAAMRDRLDAALEVVPELAQHADALRATYDAVAGLDGLEVQRIHGDLHLGQTMRTAKGWKIVDFEGEPAKPLVERLEPDSPWRDVAGMLRSFDYAPRVVEKQSVDLADDDAEAAAQLAYRAEEWAHRNRNHFLTAYAGGEPTDEAKLLLAAYVADKAVYETVYETRNRPGWVSIPLEAVARIGAA
ncbi:phosphotransferase [Nocardioides sp. Arc9.136]|uniref:maltokinase N-terminal cap-like domain-containing protein n=1 Tax=Nocardioides sp. Arc9.136 TaxID=2996826 RepID=UPI0026657B1A|nr:phosphotransferase [Nocardioides sp. Arc9.136]WKN47286.1 phosphotransferase [Nocardioides sp. Arc9.136]